MQQFFNSVQNHFNSRLPFVVYRKPGENTLHAIFQKDDLLHTTTDFSESGFVFAPFDLKNPSVLFLADFCENKSAIYQNTDQNQDNHLSAYNIENETLSKKNHLQLVQKGITAIKQNHFKKVVLSRKEEVKLSVNNELGWYKNLLKKHPLAMVYWWFHPKVGCWMGATPETLFQVNKKQFYTMSLAGTQKFEENKTVVWQEKEREEQQFVTDYIVERLEGKLTQLAVTTPKTVRAGNIMHLQTEITGTIEKTTAKTGDFIKALHPTPAVCGLPKEAAEQFILENENYHREFYTGFLGELNVKENTHLFVNLRCMKLQNQKATLYAGGGITTDSVAEKEWEETVYKSHNMKEILS